MKQSARVWNVLVTTQSVRIGFPKKKIQSLVAKLLNERPFSNLPPILNEVSLSFINDEEMRALNKKYRRKDKTTDVLSFPQYASFGKVTTSPMLGDLIISAPTMRAQAKHFGATENEELLRLIVHGLLHLAGYDHESVSKREAERMHRAERRLRHLYNKTVK